MTKNEENLYEFVDPIRLADDTVLALSAIERGYSAPCELLKEGKQLCDYLLYLFQELKKPTVEGENWTFQMVNDDKEALLGKLNDIEKELKTVEEIKEWLSDLCHSPSSITKEQINNIKQYLIMITMPMWHKRTVQFRDRKMKRSLIFHD
jgi:hypothetical protein